MHTWIEIMIKLAINYDKTVILKISLFTKFAIKFKVKIAIKI